MPRTNRRYWSDKIKGNQKRDRKTTRALRKLGWRVVRIWEHELKRDVPRAVRSIEKIIRRNPARRA
jgi:DNA mismatch endonuclease (patch repair protein)